MTFSAFSFENDTLLRHQQNTPSAPDLESFENMFSNNTLGLPQHFHPEQLPQDQPDIRDQDMLDVTQHAANEHTGTQEQPDAQFVQDIQVMQAMKAMQDIEPIKLQPKLMQPDMVANPVQSQAEQHESALLDAPMLGRMQPQMQFQKQNSQPESQSHIQMANQIPDAMQLQFQTLSAYQSQLQLQHPLVQQGQPQVQSQVHNQPSHHEQQTNKSHLHRMIQKMRMQLDAVHSQLEARQKISHTQQISQHPHPQVMQQSQLGEDSSPNSQYEGLQEQIQHLKFTAEHDPFRDTVSGFADVSFIRTADSVPDLSQPVAQLPDTHGPLSELDAPPSPPFEISYLDDSESSTDPTEVATRTTGNAISTVLKAVEDNRLVSAIRDETGTNKNTQRTQLRAAEPCNVQMEDMEVDEIQPNVPPKQPSRRRRDAWSNLQNPPKRRRVSKNGTNKNIDNGEDAPLKALGDSNQCQHQPTVNFFDSDLPLSVVQPHLRNPTAEPIFGSASDVKIDDERRKGAFLGRVKCPKCNKAFANSGAMDRHFRRSHAEPTTEEHICPECQKICCSKKNVIRHWNSVHVGELKFVCAVCEARFSTKKSLSIHGNMQHTDIYNPQGKRKPTKFWDCQMCEYGSSKSSNVIRHFFRKHSDDAFMECLKGCGMTFNSEANAKFHFPMCDHMPSIEE